MEIRTDLRKMSRNDGGGATWSSLKKVLLKGKPTDKTYSYFYRRVCDESEC